MIGQILGGYRVREKIAEGGMAEIWSAVHQNMGQKAAVKVLLPSISQHQDMVKRFLDEARVISQVRHPGIVAVYDAGQMADGRAYIVMELLAGETLQARLKRENMLALDMATRFMNQLASAIAAAHKAGIIHRDLKPDNIFVVPDPDVLGGERVKVLDFGLAKITHGVGSLMTQKGKIFGTPAYMSPEQCRDSGNVDPRTDLYAIGCIFYRCLCGRPPFLGLDLEILVSHINNPPPSPRQFRPDIPSGVENLLGQLLQKNPAERPQSGDDLALALTMVLDASIPGHISSDRDTTNPYRDNVTLPFQKHAHHLPGLRPEKPAQRPGGVAPTLKPRAKTPPPIRELADFQADETIRRPPPEERVARPASNHADTSKGEATLIDLDAEAVIFEGDDSDSLAPTTIEKDSTDRLDSTEIAGKTAAELPSTEIVAPSVSSLASTEIAEKTADHLPSTEMEVPPPHDFAPNMIPIQAGSHMEPTLVPQVPVPPAPEPVNSFVSTNVVYPQAGPHRASGPAAHAGSPRGSGSIPSLKGYEVVQGLAPASRRWLLGGIAVLSFVVGLLIVMVLAGDSKSHDIAVEEGAVDGNSGTSSDASSGSPVELGQASEDASEPGAEQSDAATPPTTGTDTRTIPTGSTPDGGKSVASEPDAVTPVEQTPVEKTDDGGPADAATSSSPDPVKSPSRQGPSTKQQLESIRKYFGSGRFGQADEVCQDAQTALKREPTTASLCVIVACKLRRTSEAKRRYRRLSAAYRISARQACLKDGIELEIEE